MSEQDRVRAFPSLRRSLLSWFAGSGVVLVLVYTALLEHYLDLGVALRTKSVLERTAASYAEEWVVDPPHRRPAPPVSTAFGTSRTSRPPCAGNSPRRHSGTGKCSNWSSSRRRRPREGVAFSCEGAPCELLFFFSYRLDEWAWLYLTQGLVATEVEDLEYDFTETVTLIIGLVFGLMLLGLALALSNRIGQPVGRLAQWADNLSLDTLDETPDFRFRELNLVAARLRGAFPPNCPRDGERTAIPATREP